MTAAAIRYAEAWCTQDPQRVAAFFSHDGSVFHWTLTGTNTGLGGTGKRVRVSGYEVWRFDANGLIAESKGHFDIAEYDRQLREGIAD
jgi:predicted ester cyclase